MTQKKTSLHILLCLALGISLLTTLFISSQASASSSGGKIYISNGVYNSTISQANLDGTGGVNLGNLGNNIQIAYDIALDLAAGKMYVVNYSLNTVTRANLDGSGGESLGNLNGTLNNPFAIALDTAAGKMYVSNHGNDTVSWADLDGTNGVSLGNFGGNLDAPMGLAIDTVGGKIYVANYATYGFGNIVRANLDGTGGENLGNLGGLVQSPRHIALDVTSGHIYIAEQLGQAILRANLNGTGGVDLGNLNGSVASPLGIALDLNAGKIYVTDNSGWDVSWGNLDGTGGESLGTLNGTLAGPYGIDLDTEAPVMNVTGNSVSISDGDDTPSTADNTDFGNVLVDGGTVEHEFEIENNGTANLVLDGSPLVEISGTNAADFTVTEDPSTPILVGAESSSFYIEFDPGGTGYREAVVTIDHLDDNGNPYNFTISGNGLVTPTVTYGGSTFPSNGISLSTGPTQITVEFNTDVISDGSADAANYAANYLLVEAGDNKTFDTQACGPAGVEGLKPDDIFVSIDSASYDDNSGEGPFVATLEINNSVELPDGSYRLFICGTTSVQDLFGNDLNDGADSTISFGVSVPADALILPATGFAPGVVTKLPLQGISTIYSDYVSVSLQIPSIGVDAPIVGVPVTENGWDLRWLSNQVGWLHSTAFPSWSGNSAITAHVYDANGNPGLFHDLHTLKWGDKLTVHAFGQNYEYEVRTVEKNIRSGDTSSVFQHEDYPWLTLITCRGYDEDSDSYSWRVVVRAIQTKID